MRYLRAAVLGLMILAPMTHAAESLRAALDLAMTNGNHSVGDDGAEQGSRRWLGGLPTLSVSYLESDRSFGTDETELSLNFPIKSPLQRNSDARLDSVDPRLDSASRRYRAWYLSGSLRDLYARERLASAALPSALRASELLAAMESQLQERLSAGSAERFDLIAIQQQRLQAEGNLAALRADRAAARRLFASLTGATALPEESGDHAPIPDSPAYDRHPGLELLALNKEQQLAALRATSASAVPWNFALVGRELDIPNFTERQLGVAIEVPISIGARPNSATRTSERALERAFQIQRDDARLRLQVEWEALQAERDRLLAREAQLAEGLDAATLSALIDQTRTSRELPIELRLQRMLALLDAQAQPALIAAQIAANSAALRQLAGLSL